MEASRIPPWAREALRRATSVALDAWNQSLQGVLELYPHTGVGVPDILIRGWEGPIFAECGGVTLLSALHRCGRRRPRLAEVRVSSIERGNKSALCVNPTDLFFTVGHELGHCFGLGECAHGEGVMAPWLWSEPPPGGPFTAERRAVIRLLEACHSLLSRSHATLGQEELAAANAARAAGLRRQAEREPSPVPLAGYELLEETSYAPPSVRDYWEGDARVRAGDLTGALASYDRVLSCGPPHPVVLLRRGWIHSALGNSEALSDFQAAVAADPSWLTARRYLIHTLKSCGHASEAQWHEARALALTRRAELEEILSHARAYRSPRMACRTLARAAVLGARHVAALVVERAAGGRVPSVKAL